jgi:carbon monoxide dehydrogenase subunit G
MITFEKTVYIKRPQQEVFEFVSDPANDAGY